MISIVASILLSLTTGATSNIRIASNVNDTLYISTIADEGLRCSHLDYLPPGAWSIVTVQRTAPKGTRVLVQLSNHKGWDTSVAVSIIPTASGVGDSDERGMSRASTSKMQRPACDLLSRPVRGARASGVYVGNGQLFINLK